MSRRRLVKFKNRLVTWLFALRRRLRDLFSKHTPSQHSRLRIENHTTTDIVRTSVTSINSLDWDGKDRPSNNFKHVRIPANDAVERREEVNQLARNCPFTMTLHFKDGLKDTFTINQKYAVDPQHTPDGFQHKHQSHIVNFERQGDKTITIKVEPTDEQITYKKSMDFEKQGLKAMKQGDFGEAILLFDEALKHVNEEQAIKRINDHKVEAYGKMAESLNKEGLKAIAEKHYSLALKLFDKALKLATEQELIESIQKNRVKAFDLQAANLDEQGLESLKGKKYDSAIKSFDEALQITQNPETVAEIKTNKARACHEKGLISYERAWTLEADAEATSSEEFNECLSKARDLLVTANELKPDQEDYVNDLKRVTVKMDANRLFTEANGLEEKASKSLDKAQKLRRFDDYVEAKNDYRQALVKYRGARSMFDEGLEMKDDRFKDNAEFMRENTHEVTHVLDDLMRAELCLVVDQLQFNESGEDDVTEDSGSEAVFMFWKALDKMHNKFMSN